MDRIGRILLLRIYKTSNEPFIRGFAQKLRKITKSDFKLFTVHCQLSVDHEKIISIKHLADWSERRLACQRLKNDQTPISGELFTHSK
jgi:hypothetical protein